MTSASLVAGAAGTAAVISAVRAEPALAAGVVASSFNVASARNGTSLTLTVTTDSDTKCVVVTGDHAASLASNSAQTSWTFNFTAGSGDGTKSVTVTARKNKECNGQSGTGSASYTLDNTAPSISGTRTPAANADGWNNTDVAVNFECSDGGSGIQACTGNTTLTANGAGQSVTGTATDRAGNTATATVGSIHIDKTAPSLAGAPTTAPNANAWYRDDVAVHWTCADPLSGLAAPCPADSTIGGEGVGLTASTSVSDRAGNTTSATSNPAVNIDRTAPLTSASAPPAWNNTDVTVTLTPSDALSGVASTHWRLDGGATQTGTGVPVTTDGDHTLSFWSTDNAGNVETAHEIHVKIDKTSPTIGHTQSPLANANGWNNTSVTVTFVCNDLLSGIASCTPPVTVTTEGAGQSVPGSAVDNAGNTASDPATVSIDETAPTIAAIADRAPNGSGWYDADVTVSYSCNDSLSGVASCSAPETLGEGEDQSATGHAADAADNTASASVHGINIDETAPTIVGTPTTSPNADGWYDGDVVVHWTCSDALSGVATCPADTTITGSGPGLTVSAAATDRAGHTTVATSPAVNIDRVAPETTSDAPAGWQDHVVTVHFGATDDYSGVFSTHYRVNGGSTQTGASTVVSTEGTTTVEFWSIDVAGNAESAHTVQVQVDTSLPTIGHTQNPAANAKGWNNTDVAVEFQCSDAVSGVASCSDALTVTTEGTSQPVAGTAVDHASNSATDSFTVSIDKTTPTIAGSPDRAPNANGWYDADVVVSFSCADDRSGVAACTSAKTLSEGAGQSATGNVADNAGNTASTTVSGLDVDKTAPMISGAPTTGPNGAGWYRDDVEVEWSCDDALSGIALGACPAPSTVHGEGDALSASASVSDRAGNVSTAAVTGLHIDRTAPTTDATAPSAWTNTGVTVELHSSDNLSGVAGTYSKLDGGGTESGTEVAIATEGVHTLEYWSVDVAGNIETHRTATVKIDLSAPTIAASLDPAPNPAGWNRTSVTVTFTCDDQPGLSGVKSCTAPVPVVAEGVSAVPGQAEDDAGNTASTSATVRIDTTKPTITGAPDRAPNANGWYRAAVDVTFTCGDALSGIASCTSPVTLGEGADQSVPGTAVDAAGNTETTEVSDLDIDMTAPTIGGAATPAPNAAGWYRGDVTVHWTCTDTLSGLDGPCPGDTVIDGEGENLSATASVADLAGNSSSATVGGVHIDRTAPVTVSDAPAGWQPGNVVVALTPFDGLSGVASTHYVLDGAVSVVGTSVLVAGEGVHTLEFWSVDHAGNEEGHRRAEVRIDVTRPTIEHTPTPAPNANGWNRTPVTVTWTCADVPSGIASCSAPSTLGGEGGLQAVSGTAVDHAGNTTNGQASVSIDMTKPTISAARDRAPNANDWYADDVTVSFTCADALSGVASCAGPQTIGEGAGGSATGTAVDLAGNSASATEGGINVDKTAPTLGGAPTTGPNAAGWYRTPVTVHWLCADTLSGLDGPCPGDSIVAAEGDGLAVSASVVDRAGNGASAAVAGLKVDRTAPATSAGAPSAWVNGDVTVTLAPADGLSGIASTHWSLDGAPAEAGTSVAIATEGVHTLEFWSVDVAGNEEAHSTITVSIDESKPTITHTQDPAPNANGWNNGAVTVTFSCDDQAGLSGIASCTPPQTVSSEGKGQAVLGEAVDHAGNTAGDAATLNIDLAAPEISGAPDRAPNAAGWYRADVTVSFTCTDALSGIATCSAPKVLHEGEDQSVTGTATDTAGNTAQATVSDLDVDTTAPTISGAPTTAPNAAGWYRGDVTVHWTCSDALSGLAGPCPADSTITGEGAALSASAGASDLAGNSSTATVAGVKIDRTAPSTSASAPTGWRNTDVRVDLTASDNLSGVVDTVFSVDGGSVEHGTSVTISAEGVHTVEFWSTDAAGNGETHRTVSVNVDKTRPSISGAPTSAANAAGWYRTPVTVHFTCTDQPGLSGIASCTGDQTLGTSGRDQSVEGAAVDHAGNTASTTVSGLHVDLVAPTVAIDGVADGASYQLGAVPAAACRPVDALSGPAGCGGTISGGGPGGVGTFTYTATATDVAGNTATRSVSYRVVYGFSGFLQPVNDTAHQVGADTSIFKAGSTVPLKFRLRTAQGAAVVAAAAPQFLTPVKGAPLSAAVDESLYGAVATSGATYRYDADGAQYLYNWSTKGLPAGFYYRVGVRLDDGTTYFVNIGLR